MTTDGLDSRDLGRKGEIEFQRVAEAAKFIVNKSLDNDSAGWDWVLNDRLTLKPERGLDSRSAPLTCVIQVKTKWEDNTSFDLKLSAAEQLAKDPKPAFVLCVLVNRETEEIVRTYLIHLLDNNLEKVLTALRAATNSNKDLNHSYVYFNPRTDGVEFSFDKKGLRSALEQLCGIDTRAYVIRKADQLRSLGFNRRSIELKTTLRSSEDGMIDFFLGKRKEIPAVIESITETRFNIPFEIAGFPQQGTLSFKQKPSDQCDVTLRGKQHALLSRFKGDLYLVPSSLIFTASRPFRVLSTFFDIVAKNNSFNLQAVDVDRENDRYNIDAWISMARSLVVLHAGGGVMEIRLKGRVIADGTMPKRTDVENSEIWTHRLKFLSNLKEALDRAAAPVDFLMSAAEVEKDYQQLTFLHQLLTVGLSDRTISYELENTAEVPSGATAISYANSYFRAGDHLLFWSAKLTMMVERINPDTLLCTAQTAEIVDLDIIHEDEYAGRVEKIKQYEDVGVFMSKSGFGVNDGGAQTVRIDFIADLNSKTAGAIGSADEGEGAG